MGTEAIRRLVVEDLPLVVLIDCEGNNLYFNNVFRHLAQFV